MGRVKRKVGEMGGISHIGAKFIAQLAYHCRFSAIVCFAFLLEWFCKTLSVIALNAISYDEILPK